LNGFLISYPASVWASIAQSHADDLAGPMLNH